MRGVSDKDRRYKAEYWIVIVPKVNFRSLHVASTGAGFIFTFASVQNACQRENVGINLIFIARKLIFVRTNVRYLALGK